MIESEEIIEFLKEIKPECNIDAGTDLFNSGVLDSFTIFNRLIPKIAEKYSIEVTPLDLIPENFMTPASIAQFITGKLNNAR